MAGVAIRLANRVSTALRPVVDLRPTVGVDHDGRLAYQSLGASGLTEAACSMTLGYGQARPGDVDAVLAGDRFG